jgi:phage terminase small subunit
MTLSNKHKAFIDSYFLHNMNATDAYCDAYGVSRTTGRTNGAKLLANANIAAEIKDRLAEKTMSADEVLTRLTDIGRGNITDLMDVTTAGYTFELLVDDGQGGKIANPKTKLIKRIRQKVTTILGKSESAEDREIIETELELYSAHDALRDLGRYHALFTDKTDLTGEVIIKTLKNVSVDEL